jgi:hypothetical protein
MTASRRGRGRVLPVVTRARPAIAFGWTATVLVVGARSRARADEPTPQLPVAFGADQVRFDARGQALDASGHVKVEEPPFHLTSSALKLRRVPIGVELDGAGTVSFCPCLGTPLALRFRGATVAPPHDLVLRNPVLELFGVPIAWAPAIWLRSTGRFGLLAPEVAWRGTDGLFVGGGVHLPWRDGDVVRGIDWRAGAYVDGGTAVQAEMRTTVSETRVAWDWWRGDQGVALGLRGATAIASGDRPDSVAWDVDALRGTRAVKATTDLDAAARPFDRADAQLAWRADGWMFASGMRAVAPRGGDLLDLGAGGPVVMARRAAALVHLGSYDATLEAGAVDGAGQGATTFARAEGGAYLATHLGSVGAALALRTFGDVADDGARTGADGAVQARLSGGLPLARGFASPDAGDPWVHSTEPRLEAAVLATRASNVLALTPGRGMTAPAGAAWVASTGWYNAVGRWGSRASAELDAYGGAVGDDRRALPVLRARAAVGGPWLGMAGDFARVMERSGEGGGGVLIARARVGPASALHLSAHVAARDGVDPVVARALVDAPLEPASGFLAAPGWTGGARVAVPLGPRVTTRAGADVDLDARRLVAALGALELHDPCNCVVVRATAAHRIGREGVDVWVSVDLPTPF